MKNTALRRHTRQHSEPQISQRRASGENKVICIYCYRILGDAAGAHRQAELRHSHECPEAELAKQPATPPPYN
jgi:hypothetical protein